MLCTQGCILSVDKECFDHIHQIYHEMFTFLEVQQTRGQLTKLKWSIKLTVCSSHFCFILLQIIYFNVVRNVDLNNKVQGLNMF